MKFKILGLVILSLLPQAYADCSWQGEWFVCSSKDNEVLKISTPKPINSYSFRSWFKKESEGEPINGSIYKYSSIWFSEINCSEKTTMLLQGSSSSTNPYFDIDKSQAQWEDRKGKVQYFPPESIYDTMCTAYAMLVNSIKKPTESKKP